MVLPIDTPAPVSKHFVHFLGNSVYLVHEAWVGQGSPVLLLTAAVVFDGFSEELR